MGEMALACIYAAMEMRVGMRLAAEMSDSQLDEFERFIDARDDAGAFKWLEYNFPHYKSVVAEEFNAVCGGLASMSSSLRTLLITQ
jgi:hypothetical protein